MTLDEGLADCGALVGGGGGFDEGAVGACEGGGGNGLPTMLDGLPLLVLDGGLFEGGLPGGGGGGGFLGIPPAIPELGLLPILDLESLGLSSDEVPF